MFSIRSAVQLGTDMLELDCHLTKDEQVVVLHDFHLKRSTGVSTSISDVVYAVSGRVQLFICSLYIQCCNESLEIVIEMCLSMQ